MGIFGIMGLPPPKEGGVIKECLKLFTLTEEFVEKEKAPRICVFF